MFNDLVVLLKYFKDLSRVKSGFKSVPPQFYFEIAGLVSAVKSTALRNVVRNSKYC